MRILVAVATRHDSTAEIAEDLAEALRCRLPGGDVEVTPAAQVGEVTTYDAVVLGSAVHSGRWLADARRVAERIAEQPTGPVWLFSGGPIDPAAAREVPDELTGIVAATHALEHRIFAGRLDRNRLRFGEESVLQTLREAARELPDWDEVDAWGARIADRLSRPAQVAEPIRAGA